MTSSPSLSRRPVRRSRWVLLGLVLVLAVLAVGAYVANGATRSAAERQTASDLQQRLRTSAPVQVTIHDPFFLRSLVRSRVDHVSLAVANPSLQVAAQPARLLNASADLYDVRLEQGVATFAGDLTGAGLVAWDELSRLLGWQVSDAGGGKLAIGFSVTLLGRSVPVTVRAVPAVKDATLTWRDADISFGGVALGGAVDQQVLQALQEVPLSLPGGLEVSGLGVTSAGLRVDVTGRDVDLGAFG